MSIAPPRPKGPPLNALRAFEAAARLGGFSAAAEELSVTPGAVAQHVKALEAWSGAPLFERRSQGVALTPLGQASLRDLGPAFDLLGEAVLALRARAAPRDIRLAALPSLAQLWLSPRLPALRAAVPGVVLSVTATERPPNPRRAPFDLALFFHDSPPPNSAALGLDEIFPVCAPALAAGLRDPADLAGQVLLSDSSWAGDWALWLGEAAPELTLVPRGPVYSLYALALEDTRNGAGVLIGHGALVAPHLASGALVAPFAHRVRRGRGLYLTPTRRDPLLTRIIKALSDGG